MYFQGSSIFLLFVASIISFSVVAGESEQPAGASNHRHIRLRNSGNHPLSDRRLSFLFKDVSSKIESIREEIREIIRAERALAPKFLRLGFHDCVGGCDGCVDLTDADNRGLEVPMSALAPIVSNWKDDAISRSDIWALATMVGAEMTQAQQDFHFDYAGRVDCEDKDGACLDTDGNPRECREDLGDFRSMPGPNLLIHEILDFFDKNFGFGAQESVALMGAHSVGTLSRANSGFDGPKGWDNTNYFLDNDYYRMLVGGDPSKANPTELEDLIEAAPGWDQQAIGNGAGIPDRVQWFRRRVLDTENIVMLNADIELARDLTDEISPEGDVSCAFKNVYNGPPRCPHAAATIRLMAEYRYDEVKFLKDFESVLRKMIINGCDESQLVSVPRPTTPATSLPRIASPQTSYGKGEAVRLSFNNPDGDRFWIGIRRHDVNPHNSTGTGSSEAWSWPCGTTSCSAQSLVSGNFSLAGISNGLWRAYMMKDMTYPYESIAFSAPFSVGEAEISTRVSTYPSGATVDVSFANPLGSRVWIAVWPADSRPQDHQSGSSEAWAWPCGSQGCNGDTLTSGIIEFGGISDGVWRAFIMLDMYSPFRSIAYSETFAVGNVDYIFASKTRYDAEEMVRVSFSNPTGARIWIAVRPADSDPSNLLGSSEAWAWPCGNTTCQEQSLTSGTFELSSVGEGEWRVWLMRDMYYPYVADAYSDAFVVVASAAPLD